MSQFLRCEWYKAFCSTLVTYVEDGSSSDSKVMPAEKVGIPKEENVPKKYQESGNLGHRPDPAIH